MDQPFVYVIYDTADQNKFNDLKNWASAKGSNYHYYCCSNFADSYRKPDANLFNSDISMENAMSSAILILILAGEKIRNLTPLEKLDIRLAAEKKKDFVFVDLLKNNGLLQFRVPKDLKVGRTNQYIGFDYDEIDYTIQNVMLAK